MKKHGSTILLILILLIGLSLLLYPTFSDWWNSMHQSRAIANYSEEVAKIDDDRYADLWESARGYNRELLDRVNGFRLPEEKLPAYNSLLNISGNGIMGYIEIPELKITLPIYHGTDEAVLQIAVGHLDWSSLPVGGESTHSVLSGHRGLPSARLFTDLVKVAEGDTFLLRVLDEVLTYAVDLVTGTHPEVESPSAAAAKYIKYGASPRAAQALITCAKVRALLNGRYTVSYEDVEALAYPVLRHRIKVNYNAVNDRLGTDDVIAMLIKETKKA